MVDYLLGEMSEEAEAQFEESYFADDELFERFLIVREELIDDYVCGRLSQSERERFDRHFLNSPQRREQVAFARALKRQFSEASVRAEVTTERQSWFSFRFPRALAWAAATAVVLLTIGLEWFVRENRRLRAELSAIRAEQQAQSEHERELRRQLAQSQAAAPSSIATPTPMPVSAPSPRLSPDPIEPFPALVLMPGLRTGQDLPKATLSPSARRLPVSLQLDDKPEYLRYSIALRSADDREIARRGGLRAKYKDDGYSITVEFSAVSLDEGEYSVTLFGHDSRGRQKEIRKYSFVVVRPKT